VRFPDNSLTAAQQQVFQTAAARWSQVITADLPDVMYQGRTIDDLEITATAPVIDGPGGILGRAGPRAFRAGATGLPYLGEMQFDSADVAAMQQNGTFTGVILHEMGHVLGIGSLWQQRGFVQGLGTANPVYVGARAVAAYNSIFGLTGTTVPVENTGGQRTAGGHWRESVFRTELMTGYAEAPGVAMPLSRITVGALQDLGYTVNYAAADPYTRPAAANLQAAAASVQTVTPSGSRLLLASSPPAQIAGTASVTTTPWAGASALAAAAQSPRRPRVSQPAGGSSGAQTSGLDSVFAQLGSSLGIAGV
jgi:hypothetical protein